MWHFPSSQFRMDPDYISWIHTRSGPKQTFYSGCLAVAFLYGLIPRTICHSFLGLKWAKAFEGATNIGICFVDRSSR